MILCLNSGNCGSFSLYSVTRETECLRWRHSVVFNQVVRSRAQSSCLSTNQRIFILFFIFSNLGGRTPAAPYPGLLLSERTTEIVESSFSDGVNPEEYVIPQLAHFPDPVFFRL